ncbi:MAG: cytochrome c biogenesis protein [Gemmataceae bacterium]|nr:cytochrome c biogenesis protein [Gemmataceae bacterium]
MDRITTFCFVASYAVALALELIHQFRPRPVLRLLALAFAAAGFLAQTLFIANLLLTLHRIPLESARGSLVFLAWVFAIFYLYGALHHRRIAWGLFVLPVVFGLSLLAGLFPPPSGPRNHEEWGELLSLHFWPVVHGVLLTLAAVGVTVAFVASVMYLVQVRRLRAKTPPGRGLKLPSLERLEAMSRRALILAFPLLTAGLLVGLVLLLQSPDPAIGYTRIISVVGLWVVFAILLYLRYGVHVRGRQTALLTILAFALMLLALVSVHPFAGGSP